MLRIRKLTSDVKTWYRLVLCVATRRIRQFTFCFLHERRSKLVNNGVVCTKTTRRETSLLATVWTIPLIVDLRISVRPCKLILRCLMVNRNPRFLQFIWCGGGLRTQERVCTTSFFWLIASAGCLCWGGWWLWLCAMGFFPVVLSFFVFCWVVFGFSQGFLWRVWFWLRTNAGGVLNTCKSNGILGSLLPGWEWRTGE